MKNNNEIYLVWYDLELNDYFAIEKNSVETLFYENLKKEGVIFYEVLAKSLTEAINKKFPKETRNYLKQENFYLN